ncbi:hypothetical protein [Corynebacterium efficiens YS-314]|uniref:Uncharacterized protein n=1 Tax=Corynebacterium efficiens (strain DSM 44549 / YS-314 / AJ 12310 / JCM 11189 / NBRC 100395) TaxID=196164 RepID=Q8FLX4_COREF|nr:hypothetical protein [Corynebacterium efficiens YS-314]
MRGAALLTALPGPGALGRFLQPHPAGPGWCDTPWLSSPDQHQQAYQAGLTVNDPIECTAKLQQ